MDAGKSSQTFWSKVRRLTSRGRKSLPEPSVSPFVTDSTLPDYVQRNRFAVAADTRQLINRDSVVFRRDLSSVSGEKNTNQGNTSNVWGYKTTTSTPRGNSRSGGRRSLSPNAFRQRYQNHEELCQAVSTSQLHPVSSNMVVTATDLNDVTAVSRLAIRRRIRSEFFQNDVINGRNVGTSSQTDVMNTRRGIMALKSNAMPAILYEDDDGMYDVIQDCSSHAPENKIDYEADKENLQPNDLNKMTLRNVSMIGRCGSGVGENTDCPRLNMSSQVLNINSPLYENIPADNIAWKKRYSENLTEQSNSLNITLKIVKLPSYENLPKSDCELQEQHSQEGEMKQETSYQQDQKQTDVSGNLSINNSQAEILQKFEQSRKRRVDEKTISPLEESPGKKSRQSRSQNPLHGLAMENHIRHAFKRAGIVPEGCDTEIVPDLMLDVVPLQDDGGARDSGGHPSPQNSQDSGFDQLVNLSPLPIKTYEEDGDVSENNFSKNVIYARVSKTGVDKVDEVETDLEVGNGSTCGLIGDSSKSSGGNPERWETRLWNAPSKWSLTCSSLSSEDDESKSKFKRVVRKTRSQLDLIRRKSMGNIANVLRNSFVEEQETEETASIYGNGPNKMADEVMPPDVIPLTATTSAKKSNRRRSAPVPCQHRKTAENQFWNSPLPLMQKLNGKERFFNARGNAEIGSEILCENSAEILRNSTCALWSRWNNIGHPVAPVGGQSRSNLNGHSTADVVAPGIFLANNSAIPYSSASLSINNTSHRNTRHYTTASVADCFTVENSAAVGRSNSAAYRNYPFLNLNNHNQVAAQMEFRGRAAQRFQLIPEASATYFNSIGVSKYSKSASAHNISHSVVGRIPRGDKRERVATWLADYELRLLPEAAAYPVPQAAASLLPSCYEVEECDKERTVDGVAVGARTRRQTWSAESTVVRKQEEEREVEGSRHTDRRVSGETVAASASKWRRLKRFLLNRKRCKQQLKRSEKQQLQLPQQQYQLHQQHLSEQQYQQQHLPEQQQQLSEQQYRLQKHQQNDPQLIQHGPGFQQQQLQQLQQFLQLQQQQRNTQQLQLQNSQQLKASSSKQQRQLLKIHKDCQKTALKQLAKLSEL